MSYLFIYLFSFEYKHLLVLISTVKHICRQENTFSSFYVSRWSDYLPGIVLN